MQRVLYLMVLGFFLLIGGCDSGETPKGQTPPATPQPPAASEEKAPAPATAEADKTEPAAQPASAVQEPADKTPAMTPAAETTAAAGAAPVTAQEQEKVAAVTETAEKAADKAAAATAAVTTAATAAVASATDKAAAAKAATTAQKPAVAAPKELILEASYGNVTFPHGMHAETYACSTCHGSATPAAFGLTKDVAHVLCRDCHKKEGAPNGCMDCHKK